jgi:hypothetical protein
VKNHLYLALLLSLACSHAPKKDYKWVSLSENGFTQNSVKVLAEDTKFESNEGFDQLKVTKQKLTDADTGAMMTLKKEQIQKIIFIGDTGCRLKESQYGGVYQNCRDPKDWAYPEVMKKIAQEKPDLIVHVGDYHYRENCSEGKPCRQMTDVIGYGWRAWEADFFAPSQAGFNVAPWIFLRGNHEECKRAYRGYQLLTEQTWDHGCPKEERTEYIDLGDLLIVQMDTSHIPDKPDFVEEDAFWEQQFKDIESHLQGTKAKSIWLVSHKPVFAVTDDRRSDNLVAINVHLQKAFAKTGLNKKINLMIAGHIHNTQYIVTKDFPLQLVVGNSGTALDEVKAFADPAKLVHTTFNGVEIQQFSTNSSVPKRFGYAVVSRTPEHRDWQVEFHDLDGASTLTLPLTKPEPAPAPKAKGKKRR